MLWDCNDGPQDADCQKGVQILAGRGHWFSEQEKLEYLLDCPPVRTAFSTVCWLEWTLAFYLTVLFKVSRVQLRFFPLQLFHVDSAPGLGKGSCYPALIKVLSHSAQRLLPASPERTAGLCFRPFCMSGACHPSPGRGVLRGIARQCCLLLAHHYWDPFHLESKHCLACSWYNIFILAFHSRVAY